MSSLFLLAPVLIVFMLVPPNQLYLFSLQCVHIQFIQQLQVDDSQIILAGYHHIDIIEITS